MTKKDPNKERNELAQKLTEQKIPFNASATTEEFKKLLDAGKQETAPENSGKISGLTKEQVQDIAEIALQPLEDELEKLKQENAAQEEKISELTASAQKNKESTKNAFAKIKQDFEKVNAEVETLKK